MTSDEKYMLRCVELALLGKGNVAPNPMVGCVIVHEGNIIGEGWHQQFGQPHAEVNALNAVIDKKLLPQATVFVNLEPCCHSGKTPPCADLLISNNIKRVVVGMIDPFSKVAGQGIAKLKAAGITVEVGVLADTCKELNKRFITYHTLQRPYVILKWAQTADGFIAPDATLMSKKTFEEKRHITGFIVQALVHKWRGEEQAIMVGTQTVKMDNPALNTRAFKGNNPLRITIDKNVSLSSELNILDGSQPTLLFTSLPQSSQIPNTEYQQIDFDSPIWPQILEELYKRSIQSIIVEGGLYTLQQIIQSNIWDEAQIFTTPTTLLAGVKSPAISGSISHQNRVDGAQLTIYQNK